MEDVKVYLYDAAGSDEEISADDIDIEQLEDNIRSFPALDIG